jgi:PiT family inorganic phosphate transporter
MFGLDASLSIVLILCLLCALAFEFINGFHDTANAVATVIYTNSLKPMQAVVWSGIWNAIGVFLGGIAVAMAIINILPINTLLDPDITHNIALILSILFTAIIWNLGTWYLGIPCSSSHTLIGSIIGAGLGYAFISGDVESGVNWGEARKIGLALLLSPLLGFGLAMLLMYLLRWLVARDSNIFGEPPKGELPPWWIRAILILTCTGVSFAHGNNDGQKGVGLMMLILVSFAPLTFSLDTGKDAGELRTALAAVQAPLAQLGPGALPEAEVKKLTEVKTNLTWMQSELAGVKQLGDLPKEDMFRFRQDILLFNKFFENLKKNHEDLPIVKEKQYGEEVEKIASYTNYAPFGVTVAIALALGLGTMVGWKRIVVTIGEKIGKQHLTYAQGASAEMVAAGTILLASGLGMSVSTTQVLSSGIAGTMVASNGLSNLQGGTIRNIAIAWLLTFPVCLALGGGLFLLLRWLL